MILTKRHGSIFLFLFLFASQTLFGASKFAIIDMQKIILTVNEGKAARSKLEKEIKKKESELQKQKKELDKLNKAWKEQAPLLSESARIKKQQEFQEKFINLRNQEMTFQAEIKRKEQQATQDIAIKVTKLASDIAKTNKYDMVFETSSSGLIYLKDPIDITTKVVSAYEKKYGSKRKKTAQKK